MQHLNDKCKRGKQLRTSAILYTGTPMESTTYKFAKMSAKRFGIIPSDR